MFKFLIGIDPGVKTGVAIYNPENKQLELYTKPFWEAIHIVKTLYENNGEEYPIITDLKLVLYIEDATQNKPVFSHFKIPLQYRYTNDKIDYIGKIAQNIGSNKRDCQLWFEFCKYVGIEYYRIRPSEKSLTKLPIKQFQLITKYKGRSSEHSRDAAMLVFDRR